MKYYYFMVLMVIIGVTSCEDVLFTLTTEYKGRRYVAQTRYSSSTPLLSLSQGTETLFNKDETEVVVSFEDNSGLENFYIFDFDFSEFQVTEDSFYDGQEFNFSYFYDKNLSSGKEVTVSIPGADRTFYIDIDEFINQSNLSQDPFQTSVTAVRGNVFDITGLENTKKFDSPGRPDDFPLGYLAIVKEFRSTITI